jgi:asparagine synthase (glutamine-hydrolysing)
MSIESRTPELARSTPYHFFYPQLDHFRIPWINEQPARAGLCPRIMRLTIGHRLLEMMLSDSPLERDRNIHLAFHSQAAYQGYTATDLRGIGRWKAFKQEEEMVMCRIAGVFHHSAEQDIKRMLGRMSQGSFNGHDIKNLPTGTLGNTCKVIQSTASEERLVGIGDVWITFDGKIYNYRELIQDHLQEDPFHSRSDSELVLRLYLKYGPPCVGMLDGIFSFAILGGQEFFLARDPLGIKPMYCCVNRQMLYFASEIKALAEVAGKPYEFPAGHWFHSRTGWRSYLNFDSRPAEVHVANSTKSVRSALQAVVSKRLLADGPTGVSLSGGFGNRMIAMLASHENPYIHSFAAGMKGSEEIVTARKVAKILGVQHHERIFDEQEVIEALPGIIYHLESFDPTLVRSAICNFFLAEIASEHVKVILTGEGAEEIDTGDHFPDSLESAEELQKELIDMATALHSTMLQRTDRIFAAFGLEVRLPFLDIETVTLVLRLTAAKKLYGNRPTRQLFREAFQSDSSREILDLPVQRLTKDILFDFLTRVAEDTISEEEFQTEHARLLNRWEYHLPSKEALYYYKFLRQSFEDRLIFSTSAHLHNREVR